MLTQSLKSRRRIGARARVRSSVITGSLSTGAFVPPRRRGAKTASTIDLDLSTLLCPDGESPQVKRKGATSRQFIALLTAARHGSLYSMFSRCGARRAVWFVRSRYDSSKRTGGSPSGLSPACRSRGGRKRLWEGDGTSLGFGAASRMDKSLI